MDWSGAPSGNRVGQVTDASRELHEELQRAVFPRYQVGEEIGRGGMSVVFRGWDTVEMRSVAIKVLKQHYSTVLGPTRFLREIRLQTQLQHPGILPLLDSGRSDTLLYYTMPLVEGETLQARLAREPQLPLNTVRQMLSQVAAALDYAHDMGVIHRDIKPSNLFVSGDRVILADFGIAKDLSSSEQENTTSTGLVLGTALYMSPEQADGQHHADGRADVYSLGCVAYQMIAGEPPFTGPNTQAVIARHRTMPAPSVKVVRPELPRGVDAVLRRALAKSPADRYQRAGDFATSLSDPAKLAAAATEAEAETTPQRRWLAPLALLTAVAVGLAIYTLWPDRPLNQNKVVVFPMGETPLQASPEGAGIEVALMIGSALEYTEPLEWIDGLPLLDSTLRRDPGLLTAADARRITRAAGARWYVDGTVVRRRDSVSVVVRINDAKGDSVVGRSSASRVAPQAAQAGLAAINTILPALLSPDQRMGDPSALADRNPGAVASWLQGEREYRLFNFKDALEFQRRAVAADSAFAVAALRGAQAANWLNEHAEAAILAKVALDHAGLLPPRLRDFARGLDAYLNGWADSAVHYLRTALRISPQWTEAHMLLGEVYYHLLPSADAPRDSIAKAEFTLAAADTRFAPPRFHLAEIAIRGGETEAAGLAVQQFLQQSHEDSVRAEFPPMLACVRAGRKAVPWDMIAKATPLEALWAAKFLAAGGLFPGCGEDGFRAVFDNQQATLGNRWGAFLGLQGLLAAEGRTTELRATVDSAVAAGLTEATLMYLFDALAGIDLEPEASREAARLTRLGTEKASPLGLWLLGAWHARRGKSAEVAAIQAALTARAAGTPEAPEARFAQILDARLTLLAGDTAATVAKLQDAVSRGRFEALEWGISEALAPERLLLAELLLATGKTPEALSVAAIFDHQAPATFLPFLPASLVLRERAALALGRKVEAKRYAERLSALGQGADPSRGFQSPSTVEVP